MEANGGIQPTILIVEDDPFLQSLLADFFVAEGYQVMQTWNGVDAVRLAHQYQPDVVLLDLHLPRKSGMDVIEDLKAHERTRALAVVIVSASARLMLTEEARRADAVVQKPFDLGTLLASVEQALAGRRALRERLVVTTVGRNQPVPAG